MIAFNRFINLFAFDKANSLELIAIIGQAAKVKWKGIRDTYRREWQKMNAKKSDDLGAEIFTSKWPFFKDLEFLKHQMVSKTASERSDVDEILGHSASNQEDSCDDLENSDSDRIKETNPLPNNGKEKKDSICNKPVSKNKIFLLQEQMLQVEKDKLNFFKERRSYDSQVFSTDPDYHFLMSLLPHLKKVRQERKLLVQMELQRVLLTEIEITPQNVYPLTVKMETTESSSVFFEDSKFSVHEHSPNV